MKKENINVYAFQDKRQYTTQLDLSSVGCVSSGVVIKVKVNPLHKLEESDFSDNEASYI